MTPPRFISQSTHLIVGAFLLHNFRKEWCRLMSKLNLKQKRFADAYIATGNIYQSALEAGYSENYAKAQSSKLLENVGIKSYIDERMSVFDKEQVARAEEVLSFLTKVMRGESLSSVVVVEGIGDGCSKAKLIDKPPDEKERIRAAELIGKRYGLWNDRVTLEGNACVQIVDDIGD